jgi:hypothetical protein
MAIHTRNLLAQDRHVQDRHLQFPARRSRSKRIIIVNNDGQARRDNAQTENKSRKRPNEDQSPLEEYDPEKYGEKTDEKEECEPALLAEYALAMTLFLASVATLTSAAAAKDLLPKKFKPLDLVVLGVATHKLSRIISKSRITGSIRSPFVHYICSCGAGEVDEEPRGRGLQRAVGELISCPYCMGPWSAAALGFGMLFAPRVTKFFAKILVGVAVSDFLHRAYAATKEK